MAWLDAYVFVFLFQKAVQVASIRSWICFTSSQVADEYVRTDFKPSLLVWTLNTSFVCSSSFFNFFLSWRPLDSHKFCWTFCFHSFPLGNAGNSLTLLPTPPYPSHYSGVCWVSPSSWGPGSMSPLFSNHKLWWERTLEVSEPTRLSY